MKTVEILSGLVALLSESGNEKEIADHIALWVGQHTTHQVTRISNSVLVHIPGNDQKKCLIFNGHIDTVKIGERSNWQTDPLHLTKKDGKLYGLGTSDMKGAVAAMMEMAANYTAKRPACDLYCMFVVEEETTGDGTNSTLNYLKPRLKMYDKVAAVIGESTKLNAVLGHRGNAFAKVVFRGNGGHASRPPKPTDQSVYKAHSFIASIEKQKEGWNKRYTDATLGEVGVAVTALQAGTGAMNQIPTETTVTLDVRTVPAFHAKLQQEIEAWAKAYGGKAKVLYPCPAGFCSPDESIAKVIMSLAKQTEVQVTQGATDQQFFTQAGVPAVICGPGDKAVIHAPNEYIDEHLLKICTARYMQIVSDWTA